MNKLIIILITLLLTSIVGFGIYNFYQTHEYKEATTHMGFKGEARENPLYAIRLFLKRMGIKAKTKESVQGLNELPNTDTVLLIDSNRSTLSNKRTLELMDWVKSGGHIIAKTTRDWKYSGSEKIDKIKKSKKYSPDPLQRYLGVHTGSKSSFEDDDIGEDIQNAIDEAMQIDIDDNDQEIEEINLRGVDKKLKLHVMRYRNIILDEDREDITEKIELDGNTFIIRQKVGKGLVTLVANMSFIENNKIEEADHAEIFWNLVHGLHKPISQPKMIWLIHNDKMPSLWDILWGKAWAFILSLLLLFGAWLLVSTHRFGPMIPKQEENRRSLNEHISSSGNFYWKHGKKAKLIESSRKALLLRLTRIHPGWEQRSKEEQVALLAKQIEVKPALVHQLLYADVNSKNFEQAETFTQLIKDIERIRNTL